MASTRPKPPTGQNKGTPIFGTCLKKLANLNVRSGSTTEVQHRPRNVRSWVTSGPQFRAAVCRFVAVLSTDRRTTFKASTSGITPFQRGFLSRPGLASVFGVRAGSDRLGEIGPYAPVSFSFSSLIACWRARSNPSTASSCIPGRT